MIRPCLWKHKQGLFCYCLAQQNQINKANMKVYFHICDWLFDFIERSAQARRSETESSCAVLNSILE